MLLFTYIPLSNAYFQAYAKLLVEKMFWVGGVLPYLGMVGSVCGDDPWT